MSPANDLPRNDINPTPLMAAAKSTMKEKAAKYPKQFLALIIILIMILTLILTLHEKDLMQPHAYNVYA